MSKLIFLEDFSAFKKGDITEGNINDKGEIIVYADFSDTKDDEHRKFLQSYFGTRFNYGSPIMKLEDFREQQIKTVIDD